MKLHQIRQSAIVLTLFILAACLGFVPLHAQSTTQGSIAGTIMDPSGAVVGNAAISIKNMGTDFTLNLTADSSGYYKAPLLEPGNYTVSVTAPGFASFRADNVVVVVGQVTSVEPRLALASSQSEVVVTEQTPVMNTESPDFSETLSQRALANIPINNRRWSALAMTTPGVVADTSGFGLVSIRGISTVLNNVEIDGADDNNSFYSEERGRTREAYSTSGSAVREFAVNTGVYSAEYGRAAGGVITSVTKSGTNQIHGQAYFWDRESNWNAFNDYTTESFLNSGTGKYVPQHIKPEDLRKIYGFTVGGAIIKDKLFWIYTYDQHTHVFPAAAIPSNANSFYALPTATANLPSNLSAANCNLVTGAWSGSATSSSPNYDPNDALDADACTLAARQGYSSYGQGVSTYDTWISNLNSDLGIVPRFGYQEINTPKLDWQINSKEHLSVLAHRLRWDSPGGVQTSTSADYARDTFGNDFVKLDYGVAKLTSLVTNNMSNEVLYQYSRELLPETQQALTPYTKQYLIGNGVTVNNSIPEVAMDTSEGFNLGSPYYSYRLANPEEWKWQVGDIFYWNKGNHSFKFGVDELHNYDFNNTYGGDGNGYFSYSYVGNYISDQISAASGNYGNCSSSAARNSVGTYPCYGTFTQTFGPHAYGIATMDSGVFGQDNWKLTPRLTLELGLRWDYEALPPASPSLTTATGSFVPYPQLTNNPSDKKNFGPRIGFSYDLNGQGQTILRGGYGVYYGRINNGELLNIRFSTGSPNGQYNTVYKPNTAGAPVLPNIVASTGASTAVPTSNFLAANLRNPEVQEYDLQLQQSLGRGTFFSLSYLGSQGRELPNFLDVNLNPTQTFINVQVVDTPGCTSTCGPLGPNGTIIQNVGQYSSYGNTALFGSVATNFQAIMEMISNVNSNYNGMVAEVLNNSLKSVQFDANYTWSHSLDFSQNANTTTTAGNNWYDPYKNPRLNYGDSSWNTPGRFVAYALYNVPSLHTDSFIKYLTNDWTLIDSFQMQTGLPYTVGVSGFFSAGILSDWNGASGSTLIPGIGPNTQRYPRHEVDDARLQKAIPFGEGRSLQLMCNVFNVANHQNVDGLGTTAYKITTSGTTNTATYQGQYTTNANNTYKIPTSSNNSGFLFTPRQVEIAAKFIF
ncbi:MAG: TonB-dependent receptor domain-containing protein [Terracidiphilus sp.]